MNVLTKISHKGKLLGCVSRVNSRPLFAVAGFCLTRPDATKRHANPPPLVSEQNPSWYEPVNLSLDLRMFW